MDVKLFRMTSPRNELPAWKALEAHAARVSTLHLRDLLDDELLTKASPLTPHASRVVLEVTERANLADVPGVGQRIALLREMGFRIAVDDLGAGYAGLTSFALLEPEIVKHNSTTD